MRSQSKQPLVPFRGWRCSARVSDFSFRIPEKTFRDPKSLTGALVYAQEEPTRTGRTCRLLWEDWNMLNWEKPDFNRVDLGAEVTAYLGSDTDATPV